MNKYSLIFVGNNSREIATDYFDDMESVLNWATYEIQKFCNDRDFKIYYTRIWNEEGYTVFDVGSHSEFFHLMPEVNYEKCKSKKGK